MGSSTPTVGRRAATVLVVVSLGLWVAGIGGPPAGASAPAVAHDAVVSAVPAQSTPNVTSGAVKAIVQIGGRMFAGGTFTTVKSQGSSTTLTRNFLMAFDAASGVVDPTFVPAVDGEVDALVAAPDGASVYVGGRFNNVNGAASKSLARLDLNTGASVAGFRAPPMDGLVNDLRLVGGRLYLAGSFTSLGGAAHGGLGAVNPSTGAVDAFMSLQVSGHHNPGNPVAPVGPKKIDVTPDGTRMVAVGNFTQVSGQNRDQIVVIDLTGASATVRGDWATGAYTPECYSSFDGYMRGLQFSPDGSYFVVVTTGGYFGGTFAACDAAARFETASAGSDVQPTWLDQTGTDSLYSVAVTGTAIYVGGHQRWQNNPFGQDAAAPGAVPRPGLAALDPTNGMPLSWNPGRNPRGFGAEALLATPTGLWVGSDTSYVGNFRYYRDRIAFFPLAGGYPLPAPNTGALPGTVHLAGPTTGASPDGIETRSYDGNTGVGATSTASTPGTAWSQARGAVMINGTLFYGWSDGNLYRRSYDGSSFGSPTLIDPYTSDPVWNDVVTGSDPPGQTYRGVKPDFYNQIPNVTGMFFTGGKLYYTIAGDPTLHARAFSPDSGIIHPQQQNADSTTNWSDAGGMFLAGGRIYWVTRSDGNLHRATFTNGHPTGTTTVSGPTIDGNDWRSRALFLDAPAPK